MNELPRTIALKVTKGIINAATTFYFRCILYKVTLILLPKRRTYFRPIQLKSIPKQNRINI